MLSFLIVLEISLSCLNYIFLSIICTEAFHLPLDIAFSSSNLIGTGSFGSIYKGSLLYFERLIAVKVLNLETRGAEKTFTAKCKALGKMKHRNLVRILTCCSSIDYKGEDFKAIFFEFMPNGSLEKMLHDIEGSENLNLNLTQRVDFALDIAHALDYLHNVTKQVTVHCDVKPSNVLLDDDNVAHLGDFGLARIILEPPSIQVKIK